MTRLLLALDEQWPTRPDCPWVLLGPDGQPVSEGHSEPRHWPAAAECEVVLTGPQCLWLEVPLPRAARRDLPRLLAYALEDRLLKDPDTQHLTLTHRRPSDDSDKDLAGVLVIARERLRNLAAQLAAIGRAPRRVMAEVQTAPPGGDNWQLSLGPAGAILRCDGHGGLALDIDILAPLVAAQATAARAANRAPGGLEVRAAPGHALPDLPALEADSGLPTQPGAPYLWWQGATGKAANLLNGDFAPRSSSHRLAAIGKPLALAGAALGIWLAATVGEVLWLKHSLSGIGERIERVYRSSFPNAPAIAPAAQMRQQLNLERARHGLLRDDDALALLARATEALGNDAAGSVAALRYEEGRLDLTLSGQGAARAEAVVGLLASRGVLADLRRDGATLHLLLRPETLQ